MITSRRALVLLIAIGSVVVSAAGESYMSLVGELMGAVESPRLIRDSCASRMPSSASENSRLYEAWKLRHKDLLDGVADQVARANARLKKQGAPGGDMPASAMLEAVRQSLEQSLTSMTSDQVTQFCGDYSKFIEKKDAEAVGSIPKLLSVVEAADRELSSRERT